MPKRQSRGRGPVARDRAYPTAALHRGALPESHCKEDLSVAYAQALAVAIGVNLEPLKRDINGWDVLFRAQDTDDADSEMLAVQLKCTVNRLARVSGGRELAFPIPADDYRQLSLAKAHPPRLLVVVEAPHHSQTAWVRSTPKQVALQASAWYVNLAGAEPLPTDQASKTVRIPVTQRFTPSALSANMRSCP